MIEATVAMAAMAGFFVVFGAFRLADRPGGGGCGSGDCGSCSGGSCSLDGPGCGLDGSDASSYGNDIAHRGGHTDGRHG